LADEAELQKAIVEATYKADTGRLRMEVNAMVSEMRTMEKAHYHALNTALWKASNAQQKGKGLSAAARAMGSQNKDGPLALGGGEKASRKVSKILGAGLEEGSFAKSEGGSSEASFSMNQGRRQSTMGHRLSSVVSNAAEGGRKSGMAAIAHAAKEAAGSNASRPARRPSVLASLAAAAADGVGAPMSGGAVPAGHLASEPIGENVRPVSSLQGQPAGVTSPEGGSPRAPIRRSPQPGSTVAPELQ